MFENKLIVFYDGDCGFCNQSVQFILNHEKNSDIHFCALQSDSAVSFFKERNLPKPDLSTFYFWNGKKLYQKSNGAVLLTKHFRFPWSCLLVFWIVPAFIRNAVYDFIAKNRHRIKAGFCVIPSEEQRKRFIK